MVDAPVSKRRFSRRQIRSALIFGGGGLLALVLSVVGWKLFASMQASSAATAQQELEEQAAAYAEKIATHFRELNDELGQLAKSTEIVSAFTSPDDEKLKTLAEAKQSQFSHALKLRFIRTGNYVLDNESVPPLSFGSLDLLKRAESNDKPVSVEGYLIGGPKQHLVMLRRIRGGEGDLLGFAHLSLDVKLAEESVSALQLSSAYLELQQGVGKRAIALAKKGQASLKSGQSVSSQVEATRWNVVFWTGSGGASSEGGTGLPLALIGAVVLIVLVVIAGLFFVKRRGGDGEDEESEIVYAGAVKAIMDGAHPGMEKMVPNLPASSGASVEVKPISKGEVGDDITMIIKKEDLKAAGDTSEMLDLTQADAAPQTPASSEPPPASTPAPASEAAPTVTDGGGGGSVDISADIFRAYDIRGVVDKNLSAGVVEKIGQSIGSEAGARGQNVIAVGRDGRNSSPELSAALIAGLKASGRDVIDVGVVPTPVLYFATHHLEVNSGVMLTGSHNGPEYNGLKIVLGGETLSEEAIQSIYKRITDNDFESGAGNVQSSEIIADYVRRVSEDIPVALGSSYKIVVDCGNGVAAAVAPQLFKALGHDVVELHCEIDGNFPNHHPDPSQPENMQDLINKVAEEQADIGFAFDGDGDRLGVVDDQGNVIWPDRQLMLLAKDVLSRNQGAPIIFDVKCSRYLKAIIESNGGQPLMWKTGHSLIKGKMKEVDAPLAGEMSGHIFFKERWYGFDDAIYTAARVLEVLMNAKVKPSETFAQMPEGVSTPELRLDLPESEHQAFMSELQGKVAMEGATVIDIDGYRIEFEDGWGLIRPSNTTPCLVMRFEAESQASLERIQGEFRTMLLSINAGLQLPF